MTDAEIREQLRAYIARGGYLDGGTIGPDDDLLAGGVIDSMGVMELVSYIEDELGVPVDDDEILPEHFRSLRAMSEFVAGKQARQATLGSSA